MVDMLTQLDGAYARYEDGLLEVSTGVVSRTWIWKDGGFATVTMRRGELVYKGSGGCDYDIFGLTACAKAELRGVNAYPIQDGQTACHLEVETIAIYPELGFCVKYVVWAYPGSAGMRTQLFVKALGGYAPASEYGKCVTETVPFPAACKVKAAGYYNDTQNRNRPDTELLREEEYASPDGLRIDWASLIALFDGRDNGVCAVKESNKCVNQPAYETGAFEYAGGVLKTTGLGLRPDDLKPDRYLFAWAAWTVFFEGGDDGLETAIKTFDRLRFQIDGARDIYIMANTWGTGSDDNACDNAAADRVLKDISAAAEIGVDVLQVDAGWHSPPGTRGFATELPWYPDKGKYPSGWETITEPAERLGLTLGLWFAWSASADEMLDNMRQGRFKYFKIDFADLGTREKLDALVDKARRVCAAGDGARVNWDVTEVQPRMGYYFGREFGNIYLENRKPKHPACVVYTPYLVLRDAWHTAKYVNLNKFQIILQNLDLIDCGASDAYLHNFPYCAMIAFMGSPILFQQVQFLSADARRALREMISVYKRHREAMYDCLVYPIGSKPDNASWTGFQFVNGGRGYIVLFRELHNPSGRETVRLKFLQNCDLAVTNVINGETRTIAVDRDGSAPFSIPHACGYVWYRYAEEGVKKYGSAEL